MSRAHVEDAQSLAAIPEHAHLPVLTERHHAPFNTIHTLTRRGIARAPRIVNDKAAIGTEVNCLTACEPAEHLAALDVPQRRALGLSGARFRILIFVFR